MSGQRGHLSRRGRAGHEPWGTGLQGWPAPHPEARRVGLGWVHWCLDAHVNFLYRFSVGRVQLLDMEQGCGLSGSCWAQACDTRGQNRSQIKGLAELSAVLCPETSVPIRLHIIGRIFALPQALLLLSFLLILDFIPELICWKGSWYKVSLLVVKLMQLEMEREKYKIVILLAVQSTHWIQTLWEIISVIVGFNPHDTHMSECFFSHSTDEEIKV